jgi:hypothetical protein
MKLDTYYIAIKIQDELRRYESAKQWALFNWKNRKQTKKEFKDYCDYLSEIEMNIINLKEAMKTL